MEYTVPGDMW